MLAYGQPGKQGIALRHECEAPADDPVRATPGPVHSPAPDFFSKHLNKRLSGNFRLFVKNRIQCFKFFFGDPDIFQQCCQQTPTGYLRDHVLTSQSQ